MERIWFSSSIVVHARNLPTQRFCWWYWIIIVYVETKSKIPAAEVCRLQSGRKHRAWIFVQPPTTNGTDLGDQEQIDALLLRYRVDPPDLPHCYGMCGAKFSIFHALNWKMSTSSWLTKTIYMTGLKTCPERPSLPCMCAMTPSSSLVVTFRVWGPG